MRRTWFARNLAGVLLAGLLSVALAGPARADHETITIDGDLTDLIDAVNNNIGSSQGGFTAVSAVGDVCTVGCCYVNGFDARNYYLFLDFKDSLGGITPNVKLFAGWDVAGKIGDTDGDGNPNTFDPFLHPGCAISDPAGTVSIGQGESYTIEVDMNCDGAADVSFSVNGDAGGQTRVWRMLPFPPVDITATTQAHFAVNNGFLELEIDDFRQLIEDALPGADICHARITMTANSANDGMGEDRSSRFSLDVPHSVKITKLPAEQTACPNGPLSWTIELTNDGLCKLESLAVTDVLDPGMTYDSDNQGSTGDAHTRNWNFTNLASGASQSITLNAHADAVWVAPVLNNNVAVVGTHTPAPLCGDAEAINNNAVATVNSLQNVGASVLTDLTRCPGASAQFCTTASGTGPFTYAWTKDGVPLAETTNCLTIASPTAGDAGEYCVTVTGACGKPVVRCATLTVSENVGATVLTDLTRCPGVQAQFCTTASGTGPFTYAWTKDGVPLAETSNCLTINSPTAGDAGEYCVTVTGACGKPVVRCATLTVSENVAATVLTDLTRCPGTEAQFCTTASGTGPFTYAWTKDGVPLAETGNCLTIASPTAGDAGEYCVTVTGACGKPAVRCATLTVSENVGATALSDLTRCPGTEAQFCTTASGTGPFTYAWTKDGSPLAETSNCLTIASPTAGDAGEYCVTVTGACGPPVPRCATLTVSENVGATVLTDLTRCPGTQAQFCTTASGTGPFTYAWTKDGSPLAEASNCLTIASPTAGDAGEYCVTVTGGCGTPVQRCATLTVSENVAATVLTDLTRCSGVQAQFCTTASGTGPFTYAWTKDGSPLSETSNCLTIASPTAGDAGEYCVTVTGACGPPVPRCATLTVAPPVAATVLNNATLCAGAPVSFCTTASGTGPFTYAWTRNGSPLSETSNCLSIAAVTAGDAGQYCVTVTGGCGQPIQRCATLVVSPNVAATTLSDVTQCPGPGTQAQFCTTASGTGPFTYTWTRNNVPIPGNSNCLTISPVTAQDAGTYCVTVSGGCGPPVTRCATLSTDCPQQVCWLTAGGARIREPGANGQPLHSWGGVVYPGCSPSAADGGNWNHIAHGQNLHFQGTHLEVVDCGNVPGIPPGSSSPETPNNFIEFRGTGSLVGTGLNRVNYPLVYFFARCEDRSEPGSKGQRNPLFKDRYYLHVYWNQADPVGSTLLLVNQTTDPTNIQPVPITDGNMQIHFSGCEVATVRHARPLNLQGEESVEPAADDLLPPGVPSPNPFRESTRIAYAVAAQAAGVEVAIFDIAGRRVRSLVSDRREPGHYTVTWDGRDDQGASVAYGMYFVRTMVSGQAQITRRVLFLH